MCLFQVSCVSRVPHLECPIRGVAMKSFASLVWLLVLSSTVHGQMFAPALMVQEDGHPKPLGLAKLQTEVRVVGAIAETTTTMTFTNPTWNIVEGYLYFPLPEGATVSSYALDIDGTMVDGVAVEKLEARRIFTDLETRRHRSRPSGMDEAEHLSGQGISHPGPR